MKKPEPSLPRLLNDPAADELPPGAPSILHPDLAEKLRALPPRPGVYLMRDARRRVLYVGKATSLRSRVRSYFQGGGQLSARIRWMVSRVADLETIVVDSEMEALLLECNLIKRHRPYFNVKYRDDKKYPTLEVSTGEAFPRLRITRHPRGGAHRSFGPFPDAGALRRTRTLLQRVFQIRTCRVDMSRIESRPCLDHHLKLCTAPCTRAVDEGAYGRQVEAALEFLEGHTDRLSARLRQELEQEAQALNFERCARIRDMLADLDTVRTRQKVVLERPDDEDYVALTPAGELACAFVMQVREGKLIGQQAWILDSHLGAEGAEVMASFLKQRYGEGAPPPPRRILVSCLPEEADLLTRWLSSRRPGGAVELREPQRGDKRRLMELCQLNASQRLEQELAVPSRFDLRSQALEELARALGLAHPPWRIEGFDISNLHGRQAVGSMVVFEHGLPRRSHYRRFKIRGAQTPDDYRMMGEVLERRFMDAEGPRSQERERAFPTLPDLLVVDGGKGQLSVARGVLERCGLAHRVPLAALAKQQEEIFLWGEQEPVRLPMDSQGLLLITHLRDEAHRFAIRYHRELRGRTVSTSQLDGLPGVGEERKRRLLRHFGSLERLMGATEAELAEVEGIGPRLASRIHRGLHG